MYHEVERQSKDCDAQERDKDTLSRELVPLEEPLFETLLREGHYESCLHVGYRLGKVESRVRFTEASVVLILILVCHAMQNVKL